MKQRIKTTIALAAISIWAITSVAHAADLVRLIDGNGVPPYVTPDRTIRVDVVSSNISSLFDQAQPYLVKKAVELEFDRSSKVALADAARLGQPGVLMKTTIAISQVGTQTFYYPVGSGVIVVGAGPNPDAVCFTQQCYNTLSPQVPVGMVLSDENSKYIWLESLPGSTEVQGSFYSVGALEQRARLTYLDQAARSSYQATVSGQYLSGYATQLSLTAKSVQERQLVLDLLKSRVDAAQQIQTVETNLSKQLDKAKRAAKAAAMFDVLSGVFSLASSAAMASSLIGEELKNANGGAPATQAELAGAVQRIESQSKSAAEALQLQLDSLQKTLQSTEATILKIGTENGMNTGGGSTGIIFRLN